MFNIDSKLTNSDMISNSLEKEYHFPTIPYFIDLYKSYPFIEKIYYVDTLALLEKLEGWSLVHQSFSIDIDEDDDNPEEEFILNGFKIKGGMTMVFKNDNGIVLLLTKKGKYDLGKDVVFERNKKIVENLSNITLHKQNPYDKYTDFIKELVCNKKKTIDRVYFIATSRDGLYLKESKINPNDVDIELLYGPELALKHDKIVMALSDLNQRGIYFFHGEPGTGKSTYIRHLVTCISTRKVIIISPNFLDQMNTPQFVPFLLDNPSSILVIEDSENIIRGRENEGSASISNLLNIGDGLMGDCFNMQIICTFNTSKENIDEALLRRGRLKYEHYFKKLSIEESQKVLDKYDIKYKADKEMTLSDIFNIDEIEIPNNLKKETKKIGF